MSEVEARVYWDYRDSTYSETVDTHRQDELQYGDTDSELETGDVAETRERESDGETVARSWCRRGPGVSLESSSSIGVLLSRCRYGLAAAGRSSWNVGPAGGSGSARYWDSWSGCTAGAAAVAEQHS